MEVMRRRKESVKGGESNQASNQIPVFSTASNNQRNSQSYIEKRSGSKEIEVTQRRKGGVSSQTSNQNLK